MLTLLAFVLCCLAILVGLRGSTGADSLNYINFFKDSTTDIFDYDNSEKGYAEEGFYLVSAIIKSVTNDYTIYFLIISSVTFVFYFKSIKYFSMFPLLSLAYYVARFMPFREMNQIRGALAIAIIIYSLKFLVVNNKRRFALWCIIASCLHYSSLLSLPFILIANKQLSLRKVVCILAASIVGGFLIQQYVKSYLLSTGNIVMLTYVGEMDLGYLNPILHYQIFICIIYSYFGGILESRQKGYNVIKNAYLYSVVILCLTAGLGTIGGRLSTIFATCEIFIIPSLILVFRQKYIGAISVGSLISLIFLMNYYRMMAESAKWIYKFSFA